MHSITGTSGHQYFFKGKKGLKLGNFVKKIPGVDLRGEAGGVILPPSIHPNGNKYEWCDEFELPELPYELLRDGFENNTTSKPNIVLSSNSVVSEGRRNSYLMSIAGTLARQMPDKLELVKTCILGLNKQICVPPLEEGEIERTIFTSLGNYHAKQKSVRNWLEPITLKELSTIENQPTEYLIEKLIPDQGTTVLSGNPGNYKTWLIFEIAKSIATGNKLFGIFNSRRSNVWIIDKENKLSVIKQRFKMIGVNDDAPIYISNTKDFVINPNTKDEIIEFALQNNIKLIIIDSLRRIHSGDENNSKDVTRVFELINSLHTHGICILLTHHHKKQQGNIISDSTSKMRGSTDILASIDSHLIVEKTSNGQLKIEQNKNRYDEEVKPFTLNIETDTTEYFRFEYSGEAKIKVSKEYEAKQHIANLLIGKSKVSRGDIVECIKYELGFGHSIVDRALEDLVLENKILKEKEGLQVYYKIVD